MKKKFNKEDIEEIAEYLLENQSFKDRIFQKIDHQSGRRSLLAALMGAGAGLLGLTGLAKAAMVIQDDKIIFPDASQQTTKADMVKSVYDPDSDAKIAKAQTEDDIKNFLIPSGLIAPWSGAISAIPSGWVLCDGNNGTPNLTDRFVIHADKDSGGTRNKGSTGGAMTHTLTTVELASHSHTYNYGESASGSHKSEYAERAIGGQYSTGNTGGGNAHSILNKYHALAYIMKT